MNSVSKECQELKRLYDSCFNRWYSEKFLRGDTDDTSCDQIYKQYKQCVGTALAKLKIEIPRFEEDKEREKETEREKGTL